MKYLREQKMCKLEEEGRIIKRSLKYLPLPRKCQRSYVVYIHADNQMRHASVRFHSVPGIVASVTRAMVSLDPFLHPSSFLITYEKNESMPPN